MSARSNPFEELERIFERMSRQFEDAPQILESGGPLERWATEYDTMPIDLLEHDDEYVVTVDLPGFERDDVSIRVTDHTLVVEAERESTVDEDEERYLRRERRHESMQRSVRLPNEVEKEDVSAKMTHGVLTVSLPKLEVAEARTIEIEDE
ncbi:Hsp20 family protein [Halobellus sp. GM3]|uniref:Hsp20 family protein n=1 Tax=Halobellus sp. GM3 TaxID=3458410 RepID=UPI00403E0F09